MLMFLSLFSRRRRLPCYATDAFMRHIIFSLESRIQLDADTHVAAADCRRCRFALRRVYFDATRMLPIRH